MSAPDNSTPPFSLAEYYLTPPLYPFALDHAGKNNASQGLMTGAGPFVARRYGSSSYADPAALDYEEGLLDLLNRRTLSFAVPLPLRTRRGALHVGEGAERGALIPLLPGTPLALQPLDGAILGAALGELQAAMAEEPQTPRPGAALFKDIFAFPATQGASLYPASDEREATRTTENDALFRWWGEEAARLQAFVEGGYRRLPMQVCHNDVTPNNLLVADGRATAVLDFEFATITARALDFATGLRLVIRHWLPGQEWAAVEPFCRGYARWATLTAQEISYLPDLLRLRGAITTLWWLASTAGSARTGQVAQSIANLRRLDDWLIRNDQELIERIGPIFAR